MMVRQAGHSFIWWLLGLAGLAAMLIAALVLALAIGATLDPTKTYYATMSSSLWTTFGPHFAGIALIAGLVSAVVRFWGPMRLGQWAIGLSVISLLAAGTIVVAIMSAAAGAGGSVNPVRGLWLSKMNVPPPDQVETFSIVDGQSLKAAIYREGKTAANAPVMVYIHGGGFMIGTNVETAADLRWFADRGWIVFSIDYRLFTDNSPTWDKAPADVACGLAWAYANAARFGGNADQVVLLGDSAGGNLAINLAYGAATGQVKSSCGDVPVPRAVVVQYSAVDPVAIYEGGYPVPGFEPQMLMKGYVGGKPEEFPDRVKAISSATYLSSRAQQTLIIEPEKDGLVVSDSVYAFADKARASGVDITLVRIPFANHVYNQIAAHSIGNQARLTITQHYLEQKGLTPKD
jgi:acetyl esterase/lipase